MEKDKKIVYDLFLKTEFTPIIFKTIAIHVLMRIGQLRGSITFTGNNLSAEKKEAAFHEFMLGDKAVRHILQSLDAFDKRKVEVLEAILKEYSMAHGHLATYDHDSLTKIFNQQMKITREHVKARNYGALYASA
jgi:hypothetical protein